MTDFKEGISWLYVVTSWSNDFEDEVAYTLHKRWKNLKTKASRQDASKKVLNFLYVMF
jgi:hypothetical protein